MLRTVRVLAALCGFVALAGFAGFPIPAAVHAAEATATVLPLPATAPGREAAERMLRVISAGDTLAAYNMLTSEAKAASTEAQFSDLIRRLASSGMQRVDWTRYKTSTSLYGYKTGIGFYKNLELAALAGHISTKVGVIIDVQIELMALDGDWKVKGIQFKVRDKAKAVHTASNSGRA